MIWYDMICNSIVVMIKYTRQQIDSSYKQSASKYAQGVVDYQWQAFYQIKELQIKSFDQLPQVSHVLDSDLERLNQALRRQKADKSYYAILRVYMWVMFSQVKRMLGHKDYSKPLLEISLSQLQGKPYFNDLRLRICEAIIGCEEVHRVNQLQHIINQMTAENVTQLILRARLEIVRAGKETLKQDFTKAAAYYLNASRQQGLLKDLDKRIQLINKSIALSYVSPRNNQNHKTICALCLNEISQRSHLRGVLKKLYTEDILSSSQCEMLQKQLPQYFSQTGTDGISVLNQARFSHNMIPIMNSFRVITFRTLQRILQMQSQKVLVLLQKTFNEGEIRIDQQDESMEFMDKVGDDGEKLKELLSEIDQIVC